MKHPAPMRCAIAANLAVPGMHAAASWLAVIAGACLVCIPARVRGVADRITSDLMRIGCDGPQSVGKAYCSSAVSRREAKFSKTRRAVGLGD